MPCFSLGEVDNCAYRGMKKKQAAAYSFESHVNSVQGQYYGMATSAHQQLWKFTSSSLTW